MKNFEATRGKFKNYLDALKQRFSTSEWKEYQSNEFCKEFGVSVILPQILKKEGYYHYENKDGIPLIMLSQKIMTLSEVTIHNKLRDYCNKSAKKNALKRKKIKAKNVVQSTLNFNKKESKPKVISTSVGLNLYNSIVDDCKNKGITISKWMYSKLGASDLVPTTEKPITKKVLDLKLLKKVYSNAEPKNKKLEKRGRPLKNNTIHLLTKPDVVELPKTIESTETKIKSLETIMNLFTKGLINQEELQSLKVGILNK
jgi:hypothetical protein